MIRLVMPNSKWQSKRIQLGAEQSLTYPHVGGTRGETPEGFVVGYAHEGIGRGEAVYEAAKRALRDFRQFDLGWVDLAREASVHEGQTVIVLARVLGVPTANPCRIVYCEEEAHGVTRTFAYAFGTLPDHDFVGEERFSLTWDVSDDSVSLQILSFSQPRSLAAKLVPGLVRRRQVRFRQDAIQRVRDFVQQTVRGDQVAASSPSSPAQAVHDEALQRAVS